ncbi:MAG: hypothetical protein KBD07_02125 [Candidatus Omnitrophica bacterium]|nr:hypothetical protein [Candidatus Omnitrophota bacterium]
MAHSTPILYCGDHDLNDAARYFAGSLRAAGMRFDYAPSDAKFDRAMMSGHYQLYILSDYPGRFLGDAGAEHIAAKVKEGAGLLMIGGWGSFTGVDGHYGQTALAEVLPVRCLAGDDRRQGAAAYRIAPGADVAHLGKPALDFSTAPTLAGFNRTILKPGSSQLLTVQTLQFDRTNTKAKVIAADPLLVTRAHGRGRATAFCTDLAPHWSGGLTDWGKSVKISAGPGIKAEVGATYAELIKRIVLLAMQKS